jgi:SagB-type dehydrogenase family enzyme
VNDVPRRILLTLEADNRPESLSELFHENTKLRRLPGVSIPGAATIDEIQTHARAYKRYRFRQRIALPDAAEVPPADRTFDEVLAARRSRRDFADADLELPQLAKILQQSYGITCAHPMSGGGAQHFRAAPSAGALYPAELYLGVRRVAGLEPGIYYYQVPDHALTLLRPGDPSERLYEASAGQEHALHAAVTVLIAAVFERTQSKYGERGYRYVLLDVGHLAQNLYLGCTALGLAVTTSGAFFDDEAATLLGLDGVDEALLYLAFVGPPASAGATLTRSP